MSEEPENYHGTVLHPQDVKVLNNLQFVLKREIPRQFDDGDEFRRRRPYFGYYAENHRVTRLGLFAQEIDYIPDSIGTLTELKELRIFRTLIDSIPESDFKKL